MLGESMRLELRLEWEAQWEGRKNFHFGKVLFEDDEYKKNEKLSECKFKKGY